jgi:hypothetical protein
VDTPLWHVTVDGDPACSSPLVTPDERIDAPACASRNPQRAEAYAAMLRERHPDAAVKVVASGCPMRGE